MKKIICILLAGSLLTVLFLEISSRIYKCKILIPSVSCPAGIQPVDVEKKYKLLTNLKDKRLANKIVSKEEYRQAANELILEVPPGFLGGYYNGKSCNNFGYVRNDLPKEAKKFVRRHELEHLLQTGKEKNPEFAANFAAGKEYPLGFLETIYFSIWNRAKYYHSPVCYILSLWKTFKIYFLP